MIFFCLLFDIYVGLQVHPICSLAKIQFNVYDVSNLFAPSMMWNDRFNYCFCTSYVILPQAVALPSIILNYYHLRSEWPLGIFGQRIKNISEENLGDLGFNPRP